MSRGAQKRAPRRRGLHLQDDAASGPGGYLRYVQAVLPRGDDPPGSPRAWGGSPPPHTPPTPTRAPLTKRLGPKHWAALDYVAGGLTTVVLFVTIRGGLRTAAFLPGGPIHFPLPGAGGLAGLVVMVAGFAVALRRRRPVLMLGVLLVGSVIATTLTGPAFSALSFFVPVAYVLYLVAATYERRRDAIRVLVAVYLTLVADTALLMIGWGGFFNEGGLISVALCVIVVWGIGYNVRQRRRYAVSLQEEAASKAVAQERLRIARELHDVVAHSMSVIAVQAGYGQYVIDSQPGDARAALGAIQATSREALDEMRRMLGALRQADDADARGGSACAALSPVPAPGSGPEPRAALSDGPGAPLFPAPGLADLDRLVARTAGAGVRVDVTRFGQPRDLLASIDLSAYRIVQEALTNVVKHARTSSCRVLLGYRDDELTIEVTDNGAGMAVPELTGAGAANRRTSAPTGTALLSRNGSTADGLDILDDPEARLDGGPAASTGQLPRALPGALPGGGHGIIGMRERVTLLGGEFSAGPLPGYGFRVSARIPLPPSA
jgi:signal transduction histidine kinase